MFDKQEFIASVYDLKKLPEIRLPEIVLCGRSNVGKSSFINSLFNKKNLAHTSSTPGKTRSLNFYKIDNNFLIVDLPGFGYAKISKKEREYWADLIIKYFNKSRNIVLAMHLIDSRHAPMELDFVLNEMLNEAGLPYIFVLTKTDKINQSEKARARKNLKEYFPEASINDNVFLYSSVKNTGRKEILSRLAALFYK